MLRYFCVAVQIMRTDLDEEQLHTESYLLDMCMGTGLRLNSDPVDTGAAARPPGAIDGPAGIRQRLASADRLDGLCEAYTVCPVPAR